ncbi:MAG: pyridoxal-phosphate dependent enzyme [Wenzhouxiangellaceae bacterium]
MSDHYPTQSTPQPQDVLAAARILQELVHVTPVFDSSLLNRHCGCQLLFKAEHLQKTGAFKYRGASYAVHALANGIKGVATHSSGNHGAALCAAAARRGLAARVIMPENAVASKIAAVRAYGGEITFCAPTQAAREAGLAEWTERGWIAIPPYDDARIIAGQGTAALELIHHQAEIDILVTPLGGGGLLAGSALAARTVNAPIEVIGAEPLGADDTYRSLQNGARVTDHHPDTIADGLRALVGELNLTVIKAQVADVIRVREATIIEAMRLLWLHLKQVVEPSAATALAAVLEQPERFAGRRVGIILSGGNVDLTALPFTRNQS